MGSEADQSAGETGDFLDYEFPTMSQQFNQRLLDFAMSTLPQGGTGVRADAIVIWLPTKSVAEHVSARSTSVTVIAYVHDLSHELGAVTVTDPVRLAALVRTVAGLRLAPDGPGGCIGGAGLQLTATFTGPGSTPKVVVTAEPDCPTGVRFAAGSVQEPNLQDDGLSAQDAVLLGTSVAALQQRALMILHALCGRAIGVGCPY